jgi:hypothetical protein
MSKLSDSELCAMLQSQHSDAMAAISASKLSSQRADATDYLYGNMQKDMPAAEGRSHAVSTDVSDTIEGMMPQLLEIFHGGDETVTFEPTSEEDVPKAEQESDYVNHVYNQANQGFMITYAFIKDALLHKVGTVKVWWESNTVEEKESYYGITDDQYQMLLADKEVEVIAHSAYPLGSEGDLDEEEAGEKKDKAENTRQTDGY